MPASANKRVSDSERKDIAGYLYGEREWTMERIAKTLDVNQSTISRRGSALWAIGS